ncbi:hypothetical protein BTVI_122972 [Pitangus sulphuratus]|nr:hypothetical protein BTVI_122972 [Pitangus sulphuratus]
MPNSVGWKAARNISSKTFTSYAKTGLVKYQQVIEEMQGAKSVCTNGIPALEMEDPFMLPNCLQGTQVIMTDNKKTDQLPKWL